MKKARRSNREIVETVLEVERLVSQGANLSEAAAIVGVNYSTLYHWRRRYTEVAVAGMEALRRLESENARLRKALLELDERHSSAKVLN